MPVEQCKYLTNCWGRKPRLGLITGTQRMYDWWPGGRKNLTRFSLRQSTICGCCAVLATHFTGSTARGRHSRGLGCEKRIYMKGSWLAGRKDVCQDICLVAGQLKRSKLPPHVFTFLHLIGPKTEATSLGKWPRMRGSLATLGCSASQFLNWHPFRFSLLKQRLGTLLSIWFKWITFCGFGQTLKGTKLVAVAAAALIARN